MDKNILLHCEANCVSGFDFGCHYANDSAGKSSRLAFSDKKGIYLYQGDAFSLMLSILKKYPDGCFDMVFADPPYFLSNGGLSCQNGQEVSVNKGAWDKSAGLQADYNFHLLWLDLCQRLLKPDGTLWVSGTLHSIYSIGFAMQQLGYKLINDIVWQKPNPPPNLARRCFTHATETLIWAAKSKKSKYFFDYQKMRKINNDKQMQSVWIISPPLLEEKKYGKHPTQKPISLIKRCIEAASKPGDFIFDPFAGSATTGVAAANLGRKFCGIEMQQEFIGLAIKRLVDATAKANWS